MCSPSQQPDHPTLSTAWLRGIQQMDSVDWSRLVHIFGPIVYRWCRAAGVREADSADLVQEVFTAVARGVTSFQREKVQGSFRSWLATITRNKIRDYWRLQAKVQAAQGGTEALLRLEQQAENLDPTISPDTIHTPLLRSALEQVRAEFEPATWEAFWQTTVDDKPAADVAQSLDLSVASVYQAKSRILRRLRKYLREIPG